MQSDPLRKRGLEKNQKFEVQVRDSLSIFVQNCSMSPRFWSAVSMSPRPHEAGKYKGIVGMTLKLKRQHYFGALYSGAPCWSALSLVHLGWCWRADNGRWGARACAIAISLFGGRSTRGFVLPGQLSKRLVIT